MSGMTKQQPSWPERLGDAYLQSLATGRLAEGDWRNHVQRISQEALSRGAALAGTEEERGQLRLLLKEIRDVVLEPRGWVTVVQEADALLRGQQMGRYLTPEQLEQVRGLLKDIHEKLTDIFRCGEHKENPLPTRILATLAFLGGGELG